MCVFESGKGQSMTVFITALAMMLGSILLIVFLFSMFLEEIEAFYDDATVDCFLASRAAILQLKAEYDKSNYSGDLEADKCKDYFRKHLAVVFNLIDCGDDTLIAKPDNAFIKYADIADYRIVDTPEGPLLVSRVDITVRTYFYPAIMPKPVYKIQTTIIVNNLRK